MKVLITGIDGFVGGHLTDFLLGKQEVEIFGTTLGEEPARRGEGLQREGDRIGRGRIRYMQADVRDRERIAQVLEEVKPDKIVHLAAQAFVPASVRDPLGTFEVNIGGALNLLEGARALRDVSGHEMRILMVSSGEVYGRVDPSRQPITEDEVLRPANPYAASKAAMDLAAQAYASSYGMEIVIARPFNHAGPGQSPAFVVSDFARRFAEMAHGRRPARLEVGNVDVSRDFTDVRDVVRAYWILSEQPEITGHARSDRRVVNVCSGAGTVIREVIDRLAELSGLVPEIVPDETRQRGYDLPSLTGSNARISELCGWSPQVPLAETIANTYHYWVEELSQRRRTR